MGYIKINLDGVCEKHIIAYMQFETLIQTRIPADVMPKITALAASEGLKVAAWLRRLVLKEVNRMRIEAWVDNKSATPRGITSSGLRPQFYLEPVQNISEKDVEFRLLCGPDSQTPGASIDPNGLPNKAWYDNRDDYRFFLRGSQDRWAMGRMWFDETSGTQMIVLRAG